MGQLGQWLFQKEQESIRKALEGQELRTAVVLTVASGMVTVQDPISDAPINQLIPVLGQAPLVGERVLILPLAGLSRVAIRIGTDTAQLAVKNTGVTLAGGPHKTIDFGYGLAASNGGSGEADVALDTAATDTRYLKNSNLTSTYVSGRIINLRTTHVLGDQSAITLTADRLYQMPFYCAHNVTVDAMLFDVMTWVAGSVAVGIYEMNTSFQATTLLRGTAKTVIGGVGVKTLALSASQALEAGNWYAFCFLSTSAMALRGVASLELPGFRGGMNASLTGVHSSAYATVTAGWAGLPASSGGPVSLTNTYLELGARVV